MPDKAGATSSLGDEEAGSRIAERSVCQKGAGGEGGRLRGQLRLRLHNLLWPQPIDKLVMQHPSLGKLSG